MTKLVVIALVVIAVLAGAAYSINVRVRQSFRGYTADSVIVEIPAGAGSRAIGDRLVEAGVIRDRFTYRIALWSSGEARRLKAGDYRFDRPMTPREVLVKIARGEVDLLSITFPEGLTVAEMSKIFAAHGMGSAASFVEAAQDPSVVESLDRGAADLEGYLFPDTYRVPHRSDARMLARAMVARFGEVMTDSLRRAASERGLSVRQLVTLASIIEKETARPEERPVVAGVYSNRLRLGMALQSDPTVIYALLRVGRFNGNLRRDDLQFDSPYNTYRYPGLPPGPVASPGKGSLEAAAHPSDVDYLYFVSRNDGTHEFSRTLAEHNRNVQRFQVQYFREKRLHGAH